MTTIYADFVNLLHSRDKKGRPKLPFVVQLAGSEARIDTETELKYGLDRVWLRASQFGRDQLLKEYPWHAVYTQAALAVRDRRLVQEKMKRARLVKKQEAEAPFNAPERALRLAERQERSRERVLEQLEELLRLTKRVKLQASRRKLKLKTVAEFNKLAKSVASRVTYSLTGSQNA